MTAPSGAGAPSGALVFVVGPPGGAQEVLPVDLVGLREASPVFAALLAPYAMEMQGEAGEVPLPREIALPDDDVFAMKAIFHALAFPGQFIRGPALPPSPFAPRGAGAPPFVAPGLSAREFLLVALAVVKYQLQGNRWVPWKAWFSATADRVLATGTAQEMVWLVAAAWVLDQRRVFPELSLELMIKHEGRARAGSFFRFCERDAVVQRVLPIKFWCKFHVFFFCAVLAVVRFIEANSFSFVTSRHHRRTCGSSAQACGGPRSLEGPRRRVRLRRKGRVQQLVGRRLRRAGLDRHCFARGVARSG